MSFDFQKGGELLGTFYPALKPVSKAVRETRTLVHGNRYVYEPGNATRYEVVFATFMTDWGEETSMTLTNFGKCMVLSGPVGMYSLGYLQEKLGMKEGDCYALLQLINTYFKELDQ